MATFSENQVRHLYVKTGNDVTLKQSPLKKFYFEVGTGDLKLRTDLIDNKKVLWVSNADTTVGQYKLKTKKLDLSSLTGLVDDNIIDIYVTVSFKQFVGQTDSDTYAKHAAACIDGVNITTVADAVSAIAADLEKSFKTDVTKLVTVTAETTKVSVEEAKQAYVRGLMSYSPVQFEVSAVAVLTEKSTGLHIEKIFPATAAAVTEGTVIPNGYKYADLEYFLMGERGDQYRGAGYPNTIPTDYKVSPEKSYYAIDIHYYEDEANMDVQRSEKTLTIISETSLADLVEQIKTIVGSDCVEVPAIKEPEE